MPLMELASGVYAFKALALADRLGVFTDLAGGRETTLAEFTARHGVRPRPADLLLTACVSLGLLERTGDSFRNSPLAEEYLVAGKPRYFGGWVKVVDQHQYRAYERLETAFRGDHPTTWDVANQRSLFAPDDPVVRDLFWDGMYSLAGNTAPALAEAVDFGAVRRLLDVGGGGAAFDIELCRAYPHLRATVFDQEFVCELTRERVTGAGLADRIDFVAGDFFTDELPTGHDAVLLSNVLHDWTEADGRALVTSCVKALEPGGVLLVCESFVNDERTGPHLAALMSLNMLVETWGRNYPAAEYTEWLTAAGLEVHGVVPFDCPGANGVLVARKP